MHGGGGGAQMTSAKSAPLPGGPPDPSWLPGAAGACRTAAQEVGRGRAGRSPSHPPPPYPRTPHPARAGLLPPPPAAQVHHLRLLRPHQRRVPAAASSVPQVSRARGAARTPGYRSCPVLRPGGRLGRGGGWRVSSSRSPSAAWQVGGQPGLPATLCSKPNQQPRSVEEETEARCSWLRRPGSVSYQPGSLSLPSCGVGSFLVSHRPSGRRAPTDPFPVSHV